MHGDEQIRDKLAAMKPFLETEYHVRELGLFGSYVRDEQTDTSDLDVLVEFDDPVSLLDLVRLENELTERLGMQVDLVTKDSLKPRIKTRVIDDVVYV
jgi:predicted nucleotidyltransferase